MKRPCRLAKSELESVHFHRILHATSKCCAREGAIHESSTAEFAGFNLLRISCYRQFSSRRSGTEQTQTDEPGCHRDGFLGPGRSSHSGKNTLCCGDRFYE